MSRKSLLVAYLLWFPLGPLGLHRVYLGSYGWAVIYFFTGGLFSIGWFVDGFTLPAQVDRANRRLQAQAPIAPAQLVHAGKFGGDGPKLFKLWRAKGRLGSRKT